MAMTAKSELEKLVSVTKDSYQSQALLQTAGIAVNVVEGRRKVLEGIANAGGQLNAYPVVVNTPYLIWAKPLEILIDSHIEPWNNWAKIKGVHQSSGDAFFSDSVSFHYFWDNPSAENYALVNVASTLVTKGFVVATGNTGFLSGGYAQLYASTSLILYPWPGQPPLTPQATATETMYGVEARGGGIWSRETGKIDTKGVFYEAGVEYKYFPIPPGARVLFEVRLTLRTTIFPGAGSTSFDFASTAQDNYVQCPSLVITILSGPFLATG
jgi:hypothetical protein